MTLLCIVLIIIIAPWRHVLGRQGGVACSSLVVFFFFTILSFQFYQMHVLEEIPPYRHVLSLNNMHIYLAFVD